MLVLAIDTSGDLASITLAKEDALVSELTFRHKMDLLRRLTPRIDELCRDSGVDKTSVTGVVISIGPGSFTGLRIGVTTAKVVAFSLGKKLVGVPTLDVLAHGASCSSGLIVPMIHARPKEVYSAFFRIGASGAIERLTEDKAVLVDDLLDQAEKMEPEHVTFCGDGAARNIERIKERIPDAFVTPAWANYPRGDILAALGIKRLAAGESDDPLSLTPHYVKRSTPEIRAEQMRRGDAEMGRLGDG